MLDVIRNLFRNIRYFKVYIFLDKARRFQADLDRNGPMKFIVDAVKLVTH